MRIYAESNLHSNNMEIENLHKPFDRLSKDREISPKRPCGIGQLKRRRMNFSFVFILLIFLPVRAIADQCVEGDCTNGKGTMIYSTGHKYVGEFKNGKRDGQGFLTMPGSRSLEGQFRHNAPIKGTYTYPDGKVYTGQWEFYERNGRGTLKYPDGRFYEGEFKSGLRTGKGVMIWPDGRRYVGDFLRGNRTGKGVMIYPDGRVYSGDFLDGERSGMGVMTFSNGERLGG